MLQIGRPDDGTDPTGFYNVEIFAPLRPRKEWPTNLPQGGWQRFVYGPKRPRSKEELIKEMNAELTRKLVGIDWNFSQNIRDNVLEALSGIKGDNSVKIFGPDLETLEDLADKVKNTLRTVRGIENVGVFNIVGQTNLELRVDLDKCKRWGISAANVNNVVQTALGGKAFATMIEGEKKFDITVRWPAWRRGSETSILDIPVDVTNNQVILAAGPGLNPSPSGSGLMAPAKGGSLIDSSNPITNTPRLLLRDLVSPVGKGGKPDPAGQFRARRRFDDLPRARQAFDRRQVQRARPRLGQRRGRGQGGDAPISSHRPIEQCGAASSRRWKRRNIGCSSLSHYRCRWSSSCCTWPFTI